MEITSKVAIEPEPSTAADAEQPSTAPAAFAERTEEHEAALPFDVESRQEAESADTPAPVPPAHEPIEAAGQPLPVTDTRHAGPVPPAAAAPETAGDWDDIPVLDDVVAELAAEYEHDTPGQPAGERAAPKRPANLSLPLPAPSRAHDLAVRTVARLNIELRKSGKRPLDPKVIARLAMMLRETLESDAAKVENKDHS
jgi:hypothetical protein